jgi:hypothetical protein
VHRILCTDLQEVTDTAIVSGSRIFIGSQKEFCKAAMGAGFGLAARFQVNHAGESRVSSSAVNSRRIQNGVHNSGYLYDRTALDALNLQPLESARAGAGGRQ